MAQNRTKTLTLTEEQLLAVELSLYNRKAAALREAEKRNGKDDYLSLMAGRAADTYDDVLKILKATGWDDPDPEGAAQEGDA